MKILAVSKVLLLVTVGLTSVVFIVITQMYIHTGIKINSDVLSRLEGPLMANDVAVITAIKNNYLDPPSTLPYNFSNKIRDIAGANDFTWPWIHQHLKTLFKDQVGGFFIEAGALNGVYLSNTLWLERSLGWNGLLIEPDRNSYKALLTKHRKAWTSNTCLSTQSFPKQTILVSRNVLENTGEFRKYWWAFRGNTHELRDDHPYVEQTESMTEKTYYKVQCFPLLSYLLALNVSKVDLLSLDIQGTEQLILHSILSSNTTSIRVIVVEDEQKKMSKEYMESKGYKLVASLKDQIYIKKDDPLINRIR